MSERKVLNKYYPPDFDPAKLAAGSRLVKRLEGRQKKKGPKLMNVRFMMPFTMCCSSCHEFSYVGKKFNSRVEKIHGEDYLGIPIWRFYGKCPNCCSEFSFKTDPKNTAYILETGGTRTYDPHRDACLAETSLRDKIRSELEGDVVKTLEHKTYTTASELQDLEQIDDLRKLNKRLLHQGDVTDAALKQIQTKRENEHEDEDTKEIRQFRKDQQHLMHDYDRNRLSQRSPSLSDEEVCPRPKGLPKSTDESPKATFGAGGHIVESQAKQTETSGVGVGDSAVVDDKLGVTSCPETKKRLVVSGNFGHIKIRKKIYKNGVI